MRNNIFNIYIFLGHWDQPFVKFTLCATLRALSRLFLPQTAIAAAAATTCAHKHISAKSVRSRAPEKLYLHLAESRKHGKVSPLHGELVLFRRSSARTCRRGLRLFREPRASGLFPPPGKTRPLSPSRTENNNDGK